MAGAARGKVRGTRRAGDMPQRVDPYPALSNVAVDCASGPLSLTACWCGAVQGVAVDEAAVEAICKQVGDCRLAATVPAGQRSAGQHLPQGAMQRHTGARVGSDYGTAA